MTLMKKIWSQTERVIEKLGGRVVATLIAAMTLTLLAVVIADGWIVSISRLAEDIFVIRNNISTLSDLRYRVTEAESAQRGYLLTKKDMYATTFNNAVAEARLGIRRLRGLVTQDTDRMSLNNEKDWLMTVSGTLEAKAAEMKLTMALAHANRTLEANSVVDLDQGVQEMAKLNGYINTLLNQQYDALNKLVTKRRTSVLYTRIAIIGTSLVLLVLVILVIRQLLSEMSMRDKLRQRLEEEVHTYESQLNARTQLLRTLALGYQSDVEREREKLARELHDELGSILTATKMDISWVTRKTRDTHPDVADKLAKTMRYIDQGIQFKRQVVQDLHPSMLATFGFWAALRSLISDMAERNQWELHMVLPEESVKFGDTIGLIVYRVVQETLNNASKYAKASKVSIHLMTELAFVKLEVEDNGVGADLSVSGGTTHGLSGMRHRVMAIGGNLEIQSSPGHGMLTRALIPLDINQA